MAKNEEIPTLRNGKWVGAGAEEMNKLGEMPETIKKMIEESKTASMAEVQKKVSEEDEKKFRHRLDSCGCIGCQFPSRYVFHERSALEIVLWDGKINGIATVVCDYNGNPKTGYVFPEKHKGKYALIPLKTSDYIFTARYVNKRRNKVIRYCVYRMVGEADGKIMLKLINVCLNTVWGHTEGKLSGRQGKEWNEKIPPRFKAAFEAVKDRLNGCKTPFAKKPSN